MKKCNGCGITVDERFRTGDVCPGCNKRWGSEYVVRPSSGKSIFLVRHILWIVMAVFFIAGSLYTIFKDYRYEAIAAEYAAQWMRLETESLDACADEILVYDVETRRKLFYMTTKHYLKRLNESDDEAMIGLIEFAPVIDSVYHARWEVYNLGRTLYTYSLYLKIVALANDDEAPATLRQTAMAAAQKIGKPKN